MPFLNSLVDPYGVLARGTYGEDNDEDWRNRRPTQRVSAAAASPPATPPSSDGGRGGGGGRGDFLASLAQMGPLIAQIFQSTATGDSIQRALSDHAATMERYNESRRLQAERAKERSFAAEQSDLDRTARKQEREDDRAFRTNLFDREQAADEERFERRTALDSAARADDRAYEAEVRNNARADALGTRLAQAGYTNAEQIGVWQEALRTTGELPPEAAAAEAQALEQQRAVERAHEAALRQGRQLSPQEAQMAQAKERLDYTERLFKDQDPLDPNRAQNVAELHQRVFGAGSFDRDWNSRAGQMIMPQPEVPPGAMADRALSTPGTEAYERYSRSLAEAPPSVFTRELETLLQGAPDPAALLEKIERALPEGHENRKIIQRLRGTQERKPTDFDVGLGALGLAGRAALGPVLERFGSPIDYANAGLSRLLSPIPRDGGN